LSKAQPYRGHYQSSLCASCLPEPCRRTALPQTFFNHPALRIRPPPPLWLARVTGSLRCHHRRTAWHPSCCVENKKPLSLTPVETQFFFGELGTPFGVGVRLNGFLHRFPRLATEPILQQEKKPCQVQKKGVEQTTPAMGNCTRDISGQDHSRPRPTGVKRTNTERLTKQSGLIKIQALVLD